MERDIMYYIKEISRSLVNISGSLDRLCELLKPEESVKPTKIKGFTNENKEYETTMVAPAFDDEPFVF